jgi:4-hydroxy-tetrahydrodipicolinate synthase
VLRASKEVVAGRRPIVAGVSELTTEAAVKFARDAEEIGVDALMVLPAMVYVPKPHELQAHFRTIAKATGLPIMLYNNPPAYRATIELEDLKRLAETPNIVAIKESSPDTRRITDIINAFGDRFIVFAGLDDVALESLLLGASGWVSGLTNAFPEASAELFAAGSCRFSVGIPITTLCSRLSLPNRSWGAARSACACRACLYWAPVGTRS